MRQGESARRFALENDGEIGRAHLWCLWCSTRMPTSDGVTSAAADFLEWLGSRFARSFDRGYGK